MFSPRLSAILRARIMVSSSRALASSYFSMSTGLARRNTRLGSGVLRPAARFMRSSARAPVRVTVPISCPGAASTATRSPGPSGRLVVLRKYPLRVFLNCTSTMSLAALSPGMSASQSKLCSLPRRQSRRARARGRLRVGLGLPGLAVGLRRGLRRPACRGPRRPRAARQLRAGRFGILSHSLTWQSLPNESRG